MSWQIYQTNQYFRKILQGKVIKNYNHIPAIYNIDRANLNKEDPTIMQLFQKNSIYTSAWHQINKSHIIDLDQIELQNVDNSFLVDSLWKPLQYENKYQYSQRPLKFKEMYLEFDYDGLIYSTNQNITLYNQKIQPNCQYQGYFPPDLRCIYNFSQITGNSSLVAFSPEVFALNNSQQVTQTFCQRSFIFNSSSIYSRNEKGSILCLRLDLDLTNLYFNNYGQNSKLQILLSSEYQSVIYNSLLKQIKMSQLPTLQDFEIKYLQDGSSDFNFLKQIQNNQQFIVENLNKINIIGFNRENEQYQFHYSINNSDCYVIQNLITLVDKMPSFYHSEQLTNSSAKYQIKNIFMLIDIVSNEKMVAFSDNILNQAFDENMQNDKQDKISNKYYRSERFVNSFGDREKNQLNGDKLQIDESIQNYIKANSLSYEILELFSSLQNLFKLLRFTTKNTFKEDPSLNLINLCLEIQHFEQFKNNRALGVCFNNIGVIHYNSGRFLESIENFQKSIIYAKYELDFYSHDNSYKSNYTFSYCEKTEQRFFQFQQAEGIQNKYKSQRDFGERSNHSKLLIDQEKQQLYWSLYNRMQNQIKALGSYIYQHKCFNLAEDFYGCIKQLIQVSNQHLPPSAKRDMLMQFYKA
ncbi:tetratricopeptide repeat protein (macronuclear) [Tetrahymena thermophila SB210]|uniref:Tetratricopeptide repeat protein n=1 Tax=Tetrahymena thermophila (strain SB210) TaxID=312017 RepID=Q245M8_TETTS|nr:tetratricopeptide repeat protein [Tetrahymena thermophila SB210]EAS03605.2 tetratricopeptide repeat protein [Tetrahymena thermophila SB210]|eukprot:XP_001023850.2 tetratricopeptide repeat protein [Tetrahymena thermophila SB210]